MRRYRRLLFGSVVAGVLGFVFAENAGYPLVGVGLYWAGVLGAVAVWQGTDLCLFDERERAIERRASAVTLLLVAVVLIVGGPTLSVLSETGLYAVPPELDGALLGYVVLFVVFGLVYTALRYRP